MTAASSPARCDWPEGIRFVVASPAVQLATSDSRRVLPDAVPRADAVFNLQRALLLVQALQHNEYEHVREALRDRWHQPFRACIVPGFTELLELRHPDLLGVCLSGSGPSVLALCTGAEDVDCSGPSARCTTASVCPASFGSCLHTSRGRTYEVFHRACGAGCAARRFPPTPSSSAISASGPLEVTYDYDAIRAAVTPADIATRPQNLWRYRELLPIAGEPLTGFHSGCTPLIRADRLARRLGVSRAVHQG